MIYDSGAVMGCSKMISIAINAFRRSLLKRANVRRIVVSITAVHRGQLLQALLRCPTRKQEKQILVFGMNGETEYLQLKR